jgi:hypothetical protein
MIDFTRRRFLFGLAAAPLVVPAVTHFVMPKITLDPRRDWPEWWAAAYERIINPPLVARGIDMKGVALVPGSVVWVSANPSPLALVSPRLA